MVVALAAIAMALLVGLFGVLLFLAVRTTRQAAKAAEAADDGRRGRRARDAVAERRRVRGDAAGGGGDEDNLSEDSESEGEDGEEEEGEAGARRREQRERKKQERRAQKRAERQARRDREEMKWERNYEYSQKQQGKEAERLKVEEAEKFEKKEKERREQQEFQIWKKSFAVEAEGEEAGSGEATVSSFVEYIKVRKVVNLEDLSTAFRLRTSAAIDRIKQLEKLDRLTGIFDDRGKYVYISEEEMSSVASWLKARGRISRADLVTACNRLIRVNPTAEDKAKLDHAAKSDAERLLQETSGADGVAA